MNRYNQYQKPMRIWDSTNAVFLEHYRMCELDGSTRNAPNTDVDHVSAWVRCTEVLHPAQSLNIIHDQLVLNDLCNNLNAGQQIKIVM